MTMMMMMIPSKTRLSPFGCSRLSYFMLLSTSLLLLLLSNDDQVGVVAAFPIKASTLPGSTSSSSSSSSSTPNISTGTSTSRRQSQRYSTTEDVIAIAYNTDIDSDFPGKEFDCDELTSSPPLSPMKLNREGNRLQLSLDDDQNQQYQHQPIVLLDGLSPDIWTSVEHVTTSSTTTTSSSSSFSSLVLQTPIPSVAIQSFPLGKFLSSSSNDDKSTTASTSNHQQHGHKFLAAARLNRYWMGPKFGGNHDDQTEIPVDTQFMLVEIECPSSKDEKAAQSSSSSPQQVAPPYYALIMPLVDGGYRSSLESSTSTIGNENDGNDEDGHSLTLVSYSESGDNVVHDPSASAAKSMNALYVAVHDDPYELLRLGFQQVSEILGGTFKTLDKKQIPSKFVNSFGWCSWDAFYSKVHPSGILEGVKCLSDAGVPAKNIILDDGWQQVSPPYLHQQEDDDKNKKKTSSLAASLSLSGSSDVMPPPPNSIDISLASSSSSTAAAAIAVPSPPPAVRKTTTTSTVAVATTVTNMLKNPLETLSNIGGSLFGVIAGGVTRCYQEYVEKAPTGSFPNRVWTFMARYSPLNYGLWKFFDSETDFGRQLNDFNPNWKFLEDEEEKEADQQKNMDLKELVTTLKKDWKVNRVYCWHAMHGYWRGVSPELGKSIGIDVTQVKTRPSDHLLRIEPEMAFDPPSLFGVGLIGGKRDLAKFYKHLHEPLVKAGVDGVKIDVQSGVTAAGMRGKGLSDNLPLAKLYTQAMEESVSQNFPSAGDAADANTAAAQAVECINCMCHSTENLYRYRKTAVARASDDFYPARPESHSVHLVNVAYNSLFLGEICLPDWDMFQSQHRSAELHAAARSIGGCPVYVSDVPGNHNVPLLKKLVLPDGSVLRAQKSGRPTRDCIFADVGRDGTSALKVWNLNRQLTTSSSATTGRNEGCGGVVGAFNVQGVAWNFETNENEILDASPSTVTASVKPHDVDSLRRIDGPFAVWSHRTKSLRVLPTGGSTIETVLEQREWEVYTVQPVQRNEEFNVQWAPIGLGRMLNSGGALIDVGRLDETGGNVAVEEDTTIRRKIIQADITTRGPGYFVSYCQPRPSQVTIHDGSAATQLIFNHDMQSGLLEFDLPAERIEGKAHHVTVKWEQ